MKQSDGIRLASILAIWTLLLGFATSTASTALAQADEKSYEFASGQVLEWTGNWEIDEENTAIEGDIELILVKGELSFLMVLSVPAGLDLDGIRDAALASLLSNDEDSITIDRGSYGDVSYSLDTLSGDGADLGAFTLLRSGENGSETFAWIFVSLIPTFASEFDKAQNSFTLDGVPPFTGIEGAGLQSQLETAIAGDQGEDAQATTESDDSTPVVDETEESNLPEDGETPTGGGLKGGSDPSTEVPDQATQESDTPEVPTGDAGLISDTAYISPLYGVEVEWGPTVILDASQDANPLASDTGLERLWLTLASDTPGFATVTILPGADTSIEGMVAVWSSDDYLADNAISPDAEVVLSESTASVGGVARLDYLDDGTPVIFYTEFHLNESGSALVMIEFYTIAPVFEDAYAIVEDELTIDGESVLSLFTATEIIEAAGL